MRQDQSRFAADYPGAAYRSQHSVVRRRLTSKGYGKSQLLDPDHPEDGVNRRVQVINAGAVPQR